ncbi:MAG TPA: class I fructose-bisphosphate aldolase [Solirubrobacteraceae bacterium]|nr:class I fructose-bisphosphate aldolase [Solirubrobacteraceae bacterium]
MSAGRLANTAASLVAPGRGILAADESTKTIAKRFRTHAIPSTEWTRRDWRELLITAPGVERWISGVILYDETLRQLTSDGQPFAQAIEARGMIPGVKVDTGTVPMPGREPEALTEGLDGLDDRLPEYAQLGARFAKWRAVFTIAPELPSIECLEANSQRLARYAACCQRHGLVPIIEPEVLMDGAHPLATCAAATQRTLEYVFKALGEHPVELDGALLKPNMVLAGSKSPHPRNPDEVAAGTVRCLRAVLPRTLAGVVFLSGGQDSEEATANLRAINATGPQPWPLSFSFGRALQQDALGLWAGRYELRSVAQAAFLERARANGDACRAVAAGEIAA